MFIFLHSRQKRSRDSVVVTVTTIRAVQSRFESRQRQDMFLFFKSSRPAVGSHNGYRGSLPAVKRPVRQADHSSPSSADVTNE
jgi:hypothetical protein